VGGIAGGDKYVVDGILFKVLSLNKIQIFHSIHHFALLQYCKDTQFESGKWLYGGDHESDEKAAKAAAHELVFPLSFFPFSL
jgi:hypothetical protein